MVAAVIVVLASAVVGTVAGVPDIGKGCHGARLLLIDLCEEVGINHPAISGDPVAIQIQSGSQKAFVACHDVCQIPKGLGCVTLGADVNMNSAASGRIALGTCLAESADQFLQKLHVCVGEDWGYQFAFFAVVAADANILLEFPFPTLGIPCAPGAVTVATSGVAVSSGSEIFGSQFCRLVAGDVIHLDLDADGLLLHFFDLLCYLCVHIVSLQFDVCFLLVVHIFALNGLNSKLYLTYKLHKVFIQKLCVLQHYSIKSPRESYTEVELSL